MKAQYSPKPNKTQKTSGLGFKNSFFLNPGLVPRSIPFGTVVAELLQAGCPSCHPTNSIKALKAQ